MHTHLDENLTKNWLRNEDSCVLADLVVKERNTVGIYASCKLQVLLWNKDIVSDLWKYLLHGGLDFGV